nr:unnamed protein product [Digitaria exilis]
MRKTDQIVDTEKDGAGEALDVHDSDVPIQAAITEEPPNDSIMPHPDEESRRVEHELLLPVKETKNVKQGLAWLLHHEEARRVEHDLSRDTAMVQSNKEAVILQCEDEARIMELAPPRDPATVQHKEDGTIVELDPLSSAEAVKCNMEARTVEQESASDYVALQSDRDATDVEEPPSHTAMMQREETETRKQETPQSGELVQPN